MGAIKREEVTIKGPHGAFSGYFAAPTDNGPVPSVLVVQEIFGVNSHIRSIVERVAGEGYAALAPDFFWQTRPGVQLGYEGEDFQEAIRLMGQVSVDKAVDDAQAALNYLASRPESQGRKQGVTGFCWGGLLTFLIAARLNPACASSHYGGRITNFISEAANITCPIMFHYGAKDQGIPLEQVAQVTAAVKDIPHSSVHVYTDAGHGFHCDVRASYHGPSARQAWQSTMQLFAAHLQ